MDSPTVPTSLLLQIVNIYITTFIAGLQTIFARKEIFFISYGFLMKEFYQENPLFEIAVDQMRNSPATAVSAVYGVNMEARSKIQDHWRAMMEGAETPQQAISSAEQEITALIEQYNLSNPQ